MRGGYGLHIDPEWPKLNPHLLREGVRGGWLCKHTQLLMPTLDTAAPQKYTRPSVWRDTDSFYLECMYVGIPTLKWGIPAQLDFLYWSTIRKLSSSYYRWSLYHSVQMSSVYAFKYTLTSLLHHSIASCSRCPSPLPNVQHCAPSCCVVHLLGIVLHLVVHLLDVLLCSCALVLPLVVHLLGLQGGLCCVTCVGLCRMSYVS